ncbi:MAG: GspH/FimT family pseudopilin [Proteobacteria bacterium]|nr:GspH/FimT family pseudopilin [Pseudomonadota bacterium]
MKIVSKSGFTLIELIITIAVLAIVLAIAIPAFTSTIQNNLIASTNNDLISALMYARSEAMKRNVPVSVCAPSDNTYTACGGSWNLGWIIFVNPTGGSALSNTTSAPMLRTQQITDQTISITTSPSVSIATYNGSGFPATNTGNVAFTIKATGCTIDSGRQITISLTGRPAVTNVTCP